MSKTFPKLYEHASTGKIKHWEISVEHIEFDTVLILTKYGIEGSKIRTTQKHIKVGKNIGRSNETTPYEQALSEAEATWKQKLDKGYVENIANISNEKLLPMLAHSFQKRKHDIVFPCYVQPKLDGVRCLAKKVNLKTIKYYSRMGKEFTTLEHLTPELLEMMKVNQVFDGEIYSHDYTFQQAISFVKKLRPKSKTLEYCIFDLVDTDAIYKERHEELQHIFKGKSIGKVWLLTSEVISSEDKVPAKHSQYVKEGYEGLIIRNAAGMYLLKKRSKDLQKYKEFKDSEFTIIGGQESTGPEAGCIVFTVKNEKDQEFAVRPRGSFGQRKKWMADLSSLIGKKLTVRYQELTDDGIPRFPVGISIRDYE